MKIVLCGSRRFFDEIREAGRKLREQGHIVFEPFLNTNKEIVNLPQDLKKYAFCGLTHHHLDFIRKADICFIFNKGGYMGNSTTLELGFATALGLPIYALSENDEDESRKILLNFIVKDVDELITILKPK